MYKKLWTIMLVFLLMLTGCVSQKGSAENVNAAEDVKLATVGINDLAADPTAYTGKIQIKGIVQSVDAKNFIFRLIDEEEFKTCGLDPCGAGAIITIYTPDSTRPKGKTPSNNVYDVKMPKVEDLVTVQGEIKRVNDGFLFEVDKVIKGSKTLIIKK